MREWLARNEARRKVAGWKKTAVRVFFYNKVLFHTDST